MAEQKNKLVLWILAIGGLVVASTVVGLILLFTVFPDLDDDQGQWLHVKITGSITETPSSGGLLSDPTNAPPTTTELSAAIRHAATDEQIEGIFLDLRSSGMGWAQAQEIRTQLDRFREEGKQCIAWASSLDNTSYYLASGCQEIHLAPAGAPMVHGLSTSRMYYKGLFDKLHITPNFAHVGDFKSAVEPFERTGPSEAAQEANDTLLNDLYRQLIDGIAQGRGFSTDQANELVQNPPITPQDALERDMVDALSFYDEMADSHLSGPLTPLRGYVRDLRSQWQNEGSQTIAVIYAEGSIIDGVSGESMMGGRFIGDRSLRKQLKQARNDSEIAAVVLRISSPGGSGSASDAIWREMMLTADQKPVVVSMGDYAASGGYYISMGADFIFAQPGTITGSIGVFGGKMNISGLLQDHLGVNVHTQSTAPYATLMNSTEDFSPDQRAKFEEYLQSFYDRFVQQAANGRGMTFDAIHEVAQGRVWTGAQALEHGLIDELGGLDDAVAQAAELAQLDTYKIKRIPERKSFLETLFESSSDPDLASILQSINLSTEAIAALEELTLVTQDGGAILLLPGGLSVQ